MGEHHTGAYENIPAPDIFIAKASALTSRIALGTGTINLPYHDPFMVAERMAFLDHLTHGRLIYGFGGGGLVSDKLFFQVGDEASPRMREAIDIIELLFSTTDYVDFDGQVLAARPQAHPGAAVPGAPAVLDRGHVGHAQLRAVRRARVRRAEHLLHAGADRGQPGHARPHRAGQRDREGRRGGGARSGRGAQRLADLSRGLRRRLQERGDGRRSARASSSRTTTCSRSGSRR